MRFCFYLLPLVLLLPGCGPALSKSDLGTVVFAVPKLTDAEAPYVMPQLGPPVERSDDHHGRGLP